MSNQQENSESEQMEIEQQQNSNKNSSDIAESELDRQINNLEYQNNTYINDQ